MTGRSPSGRAGRPTDQAAARLGDTATIPNALYHGTSSRRLVSIKNDGLVRVARFGVQCVSLSPKLEVAEYFAELAAGCDGCSPAIITFSRDALESAGFELVEFSDPVWGDGECDWEKEVSCWQDIPLTLAAHMSEPLTLADVERRARSLPNGNGTIRQFVRKQMDRAVASAMEAFGRDRETGRDAKHDSAAPKEDAQ